jgi:hypothetical protein
MIAVDIVQEIIALTLALAIVRWLQSKINSTSTTGKAIAWIYH